jgi:hypothetical protein
MAKSSPKTAILCVIRSPNVRRKVSPATVFTALGSKQEQVRQLGRCPPRELAAVTNAPECQAPVTIETVPAEVGSLEPFATHGGDQADADGQSSTIPEWALSP